METAQKYLQDPRDAPKKTFLKTQTYAGVMSRIGLSHAESIVHSGASMHMMSNIDFSLLKSRTQFGKRNNLVRLSRRVGQLLRQKKLLSLSETWSCLLPSNYWKNYLPSSHQENSAKNNGYSLEREEGQSPTLTPNDKIIRCK